MRSNFAIKRVLLGEERVGTVRISLLVNGQVPLTPVTGKVIRLHVAQLLHDKKLSNKTLFQR